ncbi:MAG: helix-turn-helix transcriptional regulator [Dysgonamonadaceae bacterium]
MKLYIKNMVCNRCKTAVDGELRRMGWNPLSIELGEVEIKGEITEKEKQQLAQNLNTLGFELLDERKSQLVERIKVLIIDLVQHRNNDLKINLSDYLSNELRHDYSYLSSLFSNETGTTINNYFIEQKIEKVKEWLVYGELTLSEMAERLNYSSVAHLSNQFKKVTGISPSHFKEVGRSRRRTLDSI